MIGISEIADRCGVSKMTVSRALSGKDANKMTEKTRKKILNVAQKYNYRPNQIANALATGKTNLIGFIGSEFRDFQRLVFQSVQETAISYGYDILAYKTVAEEGSLRDRFLKSIIDRRVEGVMLLHLNSHGNYNYLVDLQKHGIPAVVLDRQANVPEVSFVGPDNIGGMEKLTNYLIKLGHKKISFIVREELFDYVPCKERYESYCRTMLANNLKPYDIEVVPCKIYNNSRIDFQWFEDFYISHKPTAVIGNTDLIAAYFLSAMLKIGISVPDEISVAGFGNDTSRLNLISPMLTTVNEYIEEIGQKATELLFDLINNKQAGNLLTKKDILIPTDLLIRESTGHCRC